MKWHDLNQTLLQWAEGKGYQARWFPVSVVADAYDRIAALKSEGAFEEEFYQQFLSWVENPESSPTLEEKSIILVAVPRPAHPVTFEYQGKTFEVTLPPTYYRYREVFDSVKADLERLFGNRISLTKANVPYKTIAALTGLARYGLNNIAYVEGMGSYCQLLAFATPIEVEASEHRESVPPAMLDECKNCNACQRVCPAGAIQPDRFLLHGDRCLTYFSEKEGSLPNEYGRLKRGCVVGCMACQVSCPANKRLLRFENLGVHFSESETEYLIGENGSAPTPLLLSKVETLKANECGDTSGNPTSIFRRNLRAVLEWQVAHPRRARA